MDGFHVLTPPCLQKFQNALRPPPPPPPSMPPEFHNREPPLPFGISAFFLKFIFNLATPISTNEHEFRSPQGCDSAAPGDKLCSSATRLKNRLRATLLCKLPLTSEFGYKNKHHLRYFSFSLFSCVVLTFTKQNSSNSFGGQCCVPFTLHVVCMNAQ